jgi:glutamyl-tRNA reductase
MNLILVGLNHKTADIALREKLAFKAEELPEALRSLLNLPTVDESLILSTCNRVEIAAAVKDTEEGFEKIVGFLVGKFGIDRSQLLPHLYRYSATDAIKHIFRVASSLDSLVVGEAQILGQVKDAFDAALAQKSTAVVLNSIYKKAISVAKKVRTETAISQLRVSVSSVAVELAEKIFGTLAKKIVFIVGAGEMAELALKHLVGSGASEVLITTRDFAKAEALAAAFSGTAVPFEGFLSQLHRADIVICSTGAPHYLIQPGDIAALEKERKNRPMFMIDISVPRNIDPGVNEIDNVFLFDVDDLNTIVRENMKERTLQARQAESVVEAEVAEAAIWMKSLEVVPTIVAIREKGERIKTAEMEKMLAKTKGLTPEQIDAIEGLTASIVNKLLHAPVVVLKKQSDNHDGSLYVEAARKLFNLDGDADSCTHKHPHDPASGTSGSNE